MTTERRDGNEEPWRTWVRTNPNLDSKTHGLSITDIDLCVHRYMVHADRIGTRELQHVLLLEVKTFGADEPHPQADTLAVLDAALRLLRRKKIRIPGSRTPCRRVRFWGVHCLRLSGLMPPTSEQMWWDEKPITLPELEEVLRFERDPDSLQPREDRRHHAPSEAARLQLRLSAAKR